MRTIGADPEVFLRDPSTGGVMPVCGLIGGTKNEPLPLPGLPEGYAVQEDNVMMEFNIPPCEDEIGFDAAIASGLEASLTLVRTRLTDADVDYASYRAFTAEQLSSPQAKQFGCSPDYDAYKGGMLCKRVAVGSLMRDNGTAWRFAGGHVHLGYESEVPEHVVAQFADLFLGLPSVALDQQGPRRSKYGTAGRFRPTAYGIEYRTLSNFWIFDASLRQEIGWRALNVARLVEDQDKTHALFGEVPWADVQTAISTENNDLAADLVAFCTNDLNLEM